MSFDLKITNNDLQINSDGTIETVSDTPKLHQDILKIILTPLNSNQNHAWYGCSINEDILGKNLPDNIVDSQIKLCITQALERLQTLQRAQSANQRVSLAEIIGIIADVNAQRDVSDQRKINIVITVLTKRMTEVKEYFTIIS